MPSLLPPAAYVLDFDGTLYGPFESRSAAFDYAEQMAAQADPNFIIEYQAKPVYAPLRVGL